MAGVLKTIIEVSDLTPRNHARISRQMLHERMSWHGQSRIPKHFLKNRWTTPGGTYKFTRRSTAWRDVKRKFGEDPDRPNWWSGWLFSRVMTTAIVRATQHQSTWTARGGDNGYYAGKVGPSTLAERFGKPHPMRDEQRREIEIVSADERQSDTIFFERRYVQLAKRPEFRRKRKRQIG